MTEDLADAVLQELEQRGILRPELAGGEALMSMAYLRSVDVLELLDMWIGRRERIFRSTDVVGKEIARRNFEEAESVIAAVKAAVRARL